MAKRTPNLEPWLLALAAPFLLFPYFSPFLTVLSLALIPLIWVGRWRSTGRITRHTAVDWPIVTLALLLPVALWVSSNWALSIPKLTTILLGVAAYYTIVNLPSGEAWLFRLMALLVGLTAAVCLLALIGTDWFPSKIFPLQRVYSILPRWIHAVPRSARAGGFHPNEVAGTLSTLIPPAIATALGIAQPEQDDASQPDELPSPRRIWTGATVIIVVLAIVTLLLTQSRAGLLATAAAIVILAAGRRRQWLLLATPFLIGIAVAGAVVLITRPPQTLSTQGDNPLEAWVTALDHATAIRASPQASTWSVRLEIWHNAWNSLWDYPFTGSGLATFTAVTKANYPYDRVAPRFPISHAHNLYLQVGVDFGLFGLLAFLMIVASFFLLAVRSAERAGDRAHGWFTHGLVAGMCGYLIFGLFDAVTLGAKPSLVFWLILGGIVAFGRREPLGRRWERLIRQAGAVLMLLAALGVLITGLGIMPARAARGALRLDRVVLAAGPASADETLTRRALADLSAGTPFPWARSAVWRRVGRARLLLGDRTGALNAWRRDPQAYSFLLWRGWSAEASGDLSQAARHYDLAYQLRPEGSRALYRKGRLLQARGQDDDALQAYRDALSLQSFDSHPEEQADAHRRMEQILAAQEQ
jgi:putative inorganic carbon (HCO3(-)) transporter